MTSLTTTPETDASPDAGGRAIVGPRVLTAVLVGLWACYSLNGFRGWWAPIELSDANAGSGLRQVLFAGSAAVSVLLLWMNGRLWRTVRAQWRLVLLAAWLMLTVLYSDLPSITAKRSILFACGVATAAGVAAFSDQPLRRTARLLVAVTALAAWASLAWRFAFPLEITTNPGRPGLAGVSNHPNTLAPALAIGLVLALGLRPTARTGHLARVAAILGCAIALLMTASVTSIGVGLIGVVVFAALCLPAYGRAAALLAATAMIVGVLAYGWSDIAENVLSGVGRDSSMSGRGDLWSIIWNEVQQAPLFGHGWGAFWTEGKGRELVATWNPRQSHNAYLDVALDLGVVGLIAFVGLLLAPMIGRLIHVAHADDDPGRRRVSAAMLAAIASLLTVYALQQSFLGKPDAFPFIAVLLMCAAATHDRERSARGDQTPAPVAS